MAYSLKEQIDDWRAKAEENAHRRLEKENISEAQELQRLRAERLQYEAKAQRELMRQREIGEIAKSRQIVDAAKREKRAATFRKIGSAVGFVKSVFNPGKIARSPAPKDNPSRFSLFNPPNVYTGRRIRR